MPTPASQAAGLPDSVLQGLAPDAPVYTTSEAQDEFKFVAFLAPFVEVIRKSDGVHGSLQFCSNPRYYFAFVEDSP